MIERLYDAMRWFTTVGERSTATRRLLSHQVLKRHAGWVINRRHPYHLFADLMVETTSKYPRVLLRIPSAALPTSRFSDTVR